MGATLLPEGGAVFRTWAPAARDVYVVTDAHTTRGWTVWVADPAHRLFPLGDGTWAGFVPELADGDPYLFWIRGPETGTEGFKRDPYARELGTHLVTSVREEHSARGRRRLLHRHHGSLNGISSEPTSVVAGLS